MTGVSDQNQTRTSSAGLRITSNCLLAEKERDRLEVEVERYRAAASSAGDSGGTTLVFAAALSCWDSLSFALSWPCQSASRCSSWLQSNLYSACQSTGRSKAASVGPKALEDKDRSYWSRRTR